VGAFRSEMRDLEQKKEKKRGIFKTCPRKDAGNALPCKKNKGSRYGGGWGFVVFFFCFLFFFGGGSTG